MEKGGGDWKVFTFNVKATLVMKHAGGGGGGGAGKFSLRMIRPKATQVSVIEDWSNSGVGSPHPSLHLAKKNHFHGLKIQHFLYSSI